MRKGAGADPALIWQCHVHNVTIQASCSCLCHVIHICTESCRAVPKIEVGNYLHDSTRSRRPFLESKLSD